MYPDDPVPFEATVNEVNLKRERLSTDRPSDRRAVESSAVDLEHSSIQVAVAPPLLLAGTVAHASTNAV